jgi:hypothetical protein
MELIAIIREIEHRAKTREIGRLQHIRKELKGLSRIASSSIFTAQSTFRESYAYHYGGRTEMQFNIGVDIPGMFRHGVAFSFEPSQTLPRPEESLLPSVRRFNEYIDLNSDDISDMSMWDWEKSQRLKSDRVVAPIQASLIRRGVFVFLGKMQPVDHIDLDLIVDDFDRLLPLYRYVEGNEKYANPTIGSESNDGFRPGCSVKKRFTTASLAEQVLDVDLRHSELQIFLYTQLQSEYGKDCVATEWRTRTGKIDVAVKRPNGRYWFYEIKTSLSARGCIREGLAQLLEYSYWPGAVEPEKLFIVGEPELDEKAKLYLNSLREKFGLLIEYRQCVLSPADSTD